LKRKDSKDSKVPFYQKKSLKNVQLIVKKIKKKAKKVIM